MQCLNPGCDSTDAHEVNASINVSLTEDQAEKEYTGWTEYGDTSGPLGTLCNDCGMLTWAPEAAATLQEFLKIEGPPTPHEEEQA